jgi:hypothetical protein
VLQSRQGCKFGSWERRKRKEGRKERERKERRAPWQIELLTVKGAHFSEMGMRSTELLVLGQVCSISDTFVLLRSPRLSVTADVF